MTETTHLCPPEGSGLMPCCNRTPFEVPRTDRMTEDRSLVTCHALVEDTPCPACGEHALRIEMRLTAKPLGTFSLSGAQMKVSATEVPWLVCGSCGAEAEGKR